MGLKTHPSLAVHVGGGLKSEVMEPAQVSGTALAGHIGVSRQALSALLNGKASLSADMAIRFEVTFGPRADSLLRMQTAYDLAQAREREPDIKVGPFARAAWGAGPGGSAISRRAAPQQ